MPQFDGIFNAFGFAHNCGSDVTDNSKSFGPFPVHSTGKFDATVTVLYGCQPSCSVRLVVSRNNVFFNQIIDPRAHYAGAAKSYSVRTFSSMPPMVPRPAGRWREASEAH